MTVRELVNDILLIYSKVKNKCEEALLKYNLEREVESFTLDYLEHRTEFNIYLKPKRN